MNIRMSKGLRNRWGSPAHLQSIALAPRLLALVDAPLAKVHDCLVLEPLVFSATRRDAFQDRTGYEAFVNKLHVEDWVEPSVEGGARCGDLIEQGGKAALHLAWRLRERGRYRVHLSIDGEMDTLTLRFFERRTGATWGSDDPDAYAGDDVMIIDVEPRSGE